MRLRRRIEALRDTVSELMSIDEPRIPIWPRRMAGLDIHYDLGEGHPLLGRRMPDLDLDTADGPPAGLQTAPPSPARALNLR